MDMTVQAVRGAIQVDRDDPETVLDDTAGLVRAVLDRNELAPDDVISIFFTATPDLSSVFPAQAVRRMGLTGVPLLCATEMAVPGALPRVVRLLAHVHTARPRASVVHVYLRGAAALRPDLISATESR